MNSLLDDVLFYLFYFDIDIFFESTFFIFLCDGHIVIKNQLQVHNLLQIHPKCFYDDSL
jgi:hypothetical protein